MLKRTLFFSKPYYLAVKNRQLQIHPKEDGPVKSCPIEDLGFIVLDHPQISYSLNLIDELLTNNVARELS